VYFFRKGLRFYAGPMMQGLLEVGPSVLPNPPLLIRKGYLSVLLFVFGFLLPSLEIFLPKPLIITRLKLFNAGF